MMRKFLEWFFGFDPIIEELDGVDDPHDPQVVTRIWGGGIETGSIK